MALGTIIITQPKRCPSLPGYWREWDGSQCTGIKNLGYQFYTLYAQYVIPPVSTQASPNAAYQTPLHDNGFPGMFSYVGNTLIPQIPTNMQNCASSPGNYFSANTPAQI